jgi:glucose-1-phosphate thymidylyltransferase
LYATRNTCDNIFYGHGQPELLSQSISRRHGGHDSGYVVSDPQRYGIVELDVGGKALSQPKSNHAVTGPIL